MRSQQVGTYRQRVTLQQLVSPEMWDSFGQPIQSWASVGTYWAEVRPLQGRELVVARQVKAEVTHGISMRWLGLDVVLKPEMRILLTDSQGTVHTFGDLQVLNLEFRNRKLELVCKEVV